MERVEGMAVVDDNVGGVVRLIVERSLKKFHRIFVDVEEDLALYHMKRYCEVFWTDYKGQLHMLVYIVEKVQGLHLITIVVDTRSLSNEDSTISLPIPITTRICHGVITEHIDILSQLGVASGRARSNPAVEEHRFIYGVFGSYLHYTASPYVVSFTSAVFDSLDIIFILHPRMQN
jgi:hypothetical protein